MRGVCGWTECFGLANVDDGALVGEISKALVVRFMLPLEIISNSTAYGIGAFFEQGVPGKPWASERASFGECALLN